MLDIYKASAGSGKTFTLTLEYIKLLLGHRVDDEQGERWELNDRPRRAHRNILAITFTNKATDEMTARIIDELAILGGRDIFHPEKSEYEKALCDFFHTDEVTLKQLASATLDDVLMDFAYFHVSTIDAFFQTVLRTFAREVELPDDFELELDNRYTVSLGVGEMLNSINYRESTDPMRRKINKWIGKWLESFMMKNLEDGKSINLFSRRGGIQASLVDVFTRMFDEKFKLRSADIIEYLSDLNRLAAFEKALRDDYSRRKGNLVALAAKLVGRSDFGYVAHALQPLFRRISNDEKWELKKTADSAMVDRKSRYYATPFADGLISDELDELVESTLLAARDILPHEALMRIIPQAVMYVGLLGCLLRFLEDLCKENNLILLSDTSSILRDIITDDETPFVYERLGYWLDHFLIDEFQDTSKMQWENLRPMLFESLSRGESDLIIGDEKQCIYRFRNSDPALLGHEVADEIEEAFHQPLSHVRGERIAENTNWRSAVEVVKFNNSLFRVLGHLAGVDDIYGGVVQRVDDKHLDMHGHVKMVFSNDESTDDEEDGGGSIDSFAIEGMVKDVDRMLSSGRRMKDIAVLVRTHTEGQQVIDRLLALNVDDNWKHGPVEIASSDSMEVSKAASVKLVIEVMRLALTPQFILCERVNTATGEVTREEKLNPQWRRARLIRWYHHFLGQPADPVTGDKPTHASALACAVIVVTDEALLSDDDAEKRRLIVATLNESLDNETEVFDAPTLDAMVEMIVSRYISDDMRCRDTVFLTAFQDLVVDFIERSGNDLRGFIDWWDRTGRRSTLSSLADTDAITVMTIHQSKGLEMPCVIIPKADWDLVTYHRPPFKTSMGWYDVDAAFFPDIPHEIVPPMLPLYNTAKLLEMPVFAHDARVYRDTQVVDALNVAYVAFTRAIDELIVYVPKSSSKERLSSLLRSAFTDAGSVIDAPAADAETSKWLIDIRGIYDGSTAVAEYGNVPKAPFKVKKKKGMRIGTSEAKSILEQGLPSYTPSLNSEHTAFTKDDVEVFDYDDPRQRGNFIHGILSRISNLDRLELEVRRAAYKARLDDDRRQECYEILCEALSSDYGKRWFGNCKRRVAERTILTTKKNLRPDLVVWTEDGYVDVVDYKTGHNDPVYEVQVRNYVAKLRKVGYKNVRGFLWFVLDNKVIRVI